ncbi:hypothetical protein GCM10010149_06780 [Nonomuraea roseoviolacea subsp. roseoviolacea]|uniref:hypothetical protein n=1 Tax=Nonomuraea roseoviolacea TaxID=103837 RepID=UPI0033861182
MPDAITAEGLVKKYGEVAALDGMELAVPEGTVLGLLGPNGAGKPRNALGRFRFGNDARAC